MKIVAGLITISIIGMIMMGFAWTHIVMISMFASTIFFGALVIADTEDEKKETMYNDFGKPAKDEK